MIPFFLPDLPNLSKYGFDLEPNMRHRHHLVMEITVQSPLQVVVDFALIKSYTNPVR